MGMYNCYDSDWHARGFLTKEEKVEMLQEYRKSLEKEAKGVAELIQELQKNN